jgi:AP2-associated kinase
MIESADPFAALDGSKASAEDELSTRFPTLDQFSLLTDKGKKFAFEGPTDKRQEGGDPALAQRVTNALADDAFARAPSPLKPKATTEKPASAVKPQIMLQHKKSVESKEAQPRASAPSVTAPKSTMISTGTMTSPSPPPTNTKPFPERQIQRFTPHDDIPRSSSLNQPSNLANLSETGRNSSRLAMLLREDAGRSQLAGEREPRSPTSARPSLEGVSRSRSLNFRRRPASVNIGSGPTHVKDKEIKHLDYEATFSSAEPDLPGSTHADSATNITSDVDFLKAREEEEKERKSHHRRLGSGSRHM